MQPGTKPTYTIGDYVRDHWDTLVALSEARNISLDVLIRLSAPPRQLQHEPRRIRTETPPDRVEHTTATGATIRLLKRCQKCGDALPPGAKFCIMCRAPVEES